MGPEVLLMDAVVGPNKIIPYEVPHYVSYAFLSSVMLITIAVIVRGSMRMVPTGIQNSVEAIVESLFKLVEDNVGHHWSKQLFPLIGTLFMYILLCNFMGLVPGFASATANINNNAAMAIPVFLATHFYGIRVHGFKYIYHFLGPIRSIFALPLMLLMFIIEGIGHLVRPVTLSVRLFGNMQAKHIILGVLAGLAPAFIPILILALGTLVSLIQAFVFVLLATLYLAGAVEEGH